MDSLALVENVTADDWRTCLVRGRREAGGGLVGDRPASLAGAHRTAPMAERPVVTEPASPWTQVL